MSEASAANMPNKGADNTRPFIVAGGLFVVLCISIITLIACKRSARGATGKQLSASAKKKARAKKRAAESRQASRSLQNKYNSGGLTPNDPRARNGPPLFRPLAANQPAPPLPSQYARGPQSLPPAARSAPTRQPIANAAATSASAQAAQNAARRDAERSAGDAARDRVDEITSVYVRRGVSSAWTLVDHFDESEFSFQLRSEETTSFGA